ncbi:transposase [Planctomyces sp. SH-PL62]|uniref:transposase n=1 Tax=Planctomyces sp. SH-PL62 TaxID=1636152 RepID=UPI000838C920|nr:transposase [Planctomyces sp. SH-PL62]
MIEAIWYDNTRWHQARAMAKARMPDESFETVAHHPPPEQPLGLEGGRSRVGRRAVVRASWFVPADGARWEDVPAELGGSGRTAHRRLRAWSGWHPGPSSLHLAF